MSSVISENWDPTSLTKNEAWRFARLSRLNPSEFSTALELASPGIVEKCVEESCRRAIGSAGILVFIDNRLAFSKVSSEAAGLGVRFEKVETLPQFLMRPAQGMEFFATQHEKNPQCGVVLDVPADVMLSEPFSVFRWQFSAGTTFPFTHVCIGKNASAKLCEFFASVGESSASQIIVRSEIFTDTGSNFSRDFVQALNSTAQILRMENVCAAENASVRGVDFNLGADYSRATTELCASGRGASLKWRALNVASGEQETDWRTVQRHSAPDANSHLLCKNALLGRARTIFSGNIIVEKSAQQTESVQSCRNLLLSEEAEAHSLPGLEIDANDVRCSHGATTGTLDAEQLFYLLQRGLPEADARMLLTLGFMDEVVNACAGCAVPDFVREKIAEKFGL